jgi:hypothetical protein
MRDVGSGCTQRQPRTFPMNAGESLTAAYRLVGLPCVGSLATASWLVYLASGAA